MYNEKKFARLLTKKCRVHQNQLDEPSELKTIEMSRIFFECLDAKKIALAFIELIYNFFWFVLCSDCISTFTKQIDK